MARKLCDKGECLRFDLEAENKRLRDAIEDMMAIATRNGEAVLMLLAIRDVGKHVLAQ